MRFESTLAIIGSCELAAKNFSIPLFCWVTGIIYGGVAVTHILIVAQ